MNWLVTVILDLEVGQQIKDAVDTARDTALHLGLDKLGIVKVRDGKEEFIVLREEDFVEWFGD